MAHTINRSSAYLSRNNHSYCFRIRVPVDIQRYLGKKELRYSLRTGYLGQAKLKARGLASMVQQLFQELRGDALRFMELSDQEIQKLVLRHLDKIKAEYDKPAPFGPFDPPPLESDRDLSGFIDALSGLIGELQAEMAGGDYSKVIDEARSLLAQGDSIDEGSLGFKKLCAGLMRAEIKGIDYHRSRLAGKYGDDLEHSMNQAFPPKDRFQKPNILQLAKESQTDTNDTLKTILDEYWKRKKGGWAAAALESYERYQKRLIDHFGKDKPINTIDYKAMEQFRDKLKETGNRGKPIADKTVNLHLEFYSGVFNHAIQSGRISHNPLGGVKFADKRDQQLLNDPFPKEDLVKLFHSKEYTNDTFINGWMFWLPVLSLYTGARLEELCQLYIDEIKVVDGIWVFDIDETRPDQSVKAHEKRYIPLHPFITDELYFIEYAHSLSDQNGRLFPELKPIGKRQRYGHGPSSNWFRPYKIRCGVVAPPRKKTIHSLRHNVSSSLMEQDVQEFVIAMLLGHKHDQITTGRYGKKFEPRMLLEKAVLKLDYGIDLSHLKKSHWVIK